MWVGGPPNPVTPIRVHWRATARSGTASAAGSGIRRSDSASARGDPGEGLAVEAVDLSTPPALRRTDLDVEVERGRVPVERRPLQPGVAARHREPRQVRASSAPPTPPRRCAGGTYRSSSQIPGRHSQVENVR